MRRTYRLHPREAADLVAHVGPRLKQARKESGLTRNKLAEMIRRNPSLITLWEQGVCAPNPESLQRACAVLDRVPAWFFPGFDEGPEGGREESLQRVREKGRK